MNWNALPGIACILSFFFPVGVIIYNRFYTQRSLAALLIYYVMATLENLMSQGLFPVSENFSNLFGILTHYFEIPLLLTALLFFCPNKQKKKIITALTLSFIVYEFAVTCIHGFTHEAIVYIKGPGLCLILVYTFFLFVWQVKFSIMHGKNQGRTFMLASLLFAYACYALIYYFNYIQKTPYKDDTRLLYYISFFIASNLMGIGLHLMRKRIKELQSLKVTRKELALFFGHA